MKTTLYVVGILIFVISCLATVTSWGHELTKPQTNIDVLVTVPDVIARGFSFLFSLVCICAAAVIGAIEKAAAKQP
jgi:hypothetical protein